MSRPRPNRVTPLGDIVAAPDRGTLMGNRGILHDDSGRIRRPWQNRRWILCQLDFAGRKRAVMTPGRYTELFFLDEATGLAAGHRPCFECQRARYQAYREAWVQAEGVTDTSVTADAIDRRLHGERRASAPNAPRCIVRRRDVPAGVVALPRRANARPELC